MDEYEEPSVATASATQRGHAVVLSGPGNWHAWMFFIRGDVASDVWRYVDPDLAEEPVLPEKPQRPQYPEDDSPDNLKRYELKLNSYNGEMKEYKELHKQLQKVKTAISTSINPDLQTHFFVLNREADTAYGRLKALKNNVAPSDEGRELIVTADYEALKRVQKRLGIETWLNKFKKVCNEATFLKLPIVAGNRAKIDFLNAVRVWEEAWAASKIAALADEFPSQTQTLAELIEAFIRMRRLTAGSVAVTKAKAIRTTAAFPGASLQGRRDAPGPCICKERHWYSDCPYLNEAVRPSDWSPDETTKTYVDAQMEDPDTRNRVLYSIQRSNDRVKKGVNMNDRVNKQSKQVNEGLQGHKQGRRNRNFKNRNNNKNRDVSTSQKLTNDVSGDPELLNFSNAAAASASTIQALQQQWILDSGSDIHITNNRRVLTDVRAETGSKVISGATQYAVEAVGTAHISVNTPNGPATMTLPDVAYIPHFMTNVVSLSLLTRKNTHWNTEDGCLRRNGRKIAFVRRFKGHWTLSDGRTPRPTLTTQEDEDDAYEGVESLFSVLTVQRCRDCNSHMSFAAEKSVDDTVSSLWHARLGHPGIDALSHLSSSALGVSRFVLDKTICETCALAKATELISRSADREISEEHPFHRVSCDLIELEPGFNGDRYIVHFQDFLTGFSVIFNEPRRGGFMRIFKLFIFHVKTQYRQQVRIIRIDGESSMSAEVREFLRLQGILLEISAPYTPEQNGHAERMGRTLITKARALRIHSRLPHDLWPEIVRTAAYLMNRTPTRRIGWKTPHEALFGDKPSLRHLHIVGCKAYTLRHNIQRGKKLDARARIGYLVGYDSTNIWRIWDPTAGYTIIRARSVRFDEGQKFDPDEFKLNPPLDTFETLADTMDLSAFDAARGAGLDQWFECLVISGLAYHVSYLLNVLIIPYSICVLSMAYYLLVHHGN